AFRVRPRAGTFVVDRQDGLGDHAPAMQSRPRVLVAIVLVALVGVQLRGAEVATPAQKCGALKLRAAGREIAGKMRCYADAKQAGAGVDSTCLGIAQSKADTAINKAG